MESALAFLVGGGILIFVILAVIAVTLLVVVTVAGPAHGLARLLLGLLAWIRRHARSKPSQTGVSVH